MDDISHITEYWNHILNRNTSLAGGSIEKRRFESPLGLSINNKTKNPRKMGQGTGILSQLLPVCWQFVSKNSKALEIF